MRIPRALLRARVRDWPLISDDGEHGNLLTTKGGSPEISLHSFAVKASDLIFVERSLCRPHVVGGQRILRTGGYLRKLLLLKRFHVMCTYHET